MTSTSSTHTLVLAWTIKIVGGLLALGLLIVASAALAGPIHELFMQWGWMADAPHKERLDGFLKVFRRLIVILVLAAGIAYFRPWRQLQQGEDDYGLRGERARARPAIVGFFTMFFVIVAVLTWHFFEGWLKWENPLDWGKAAKRFGRALLSPGLTVALLEEFIFRGWLHARAASVMPPVRAGLVGSFIFAILHAFRPSSSVVNVSFDTAGALEAFESWLAFAVDPSGFGPAFVGLFLFGMMMTAAYLRTRTLWTPIAIHMAGAWLIYSYGSLTDRHPGRNWAGGKLLYDGPVAWVLLLVATVWLWPKKKARAT